MDQVRAETFFDQVARTLAEPMPRRRAVRVIGASIAGLAVSGVSPRSARAAIVGGSDFGPSVCPGRQICSTYIDPNNWPAGQKTKCCPFPRAQWRCGGPDGWTCIDGCAAVGKQFGRRTEATWSAETKGGSDPTVSAEPKRYDCCILPDYIPRDGECLPNCELLHGPGARQCGHGCCPDGTFCCDRVFTLKDPYCCGSEEYFKEPWKDGEFASILVTIAVGAIAAGTGGLALVILVGFGAGWGLVGAYAKMVGDDPPDPRYKELFRPRVPRVASVPVGDGVTPAAARALDRMIANRLRAGAYGLAYIRSIEKTQGAEEGHDKTWARRHRKAAASYAREAATTLERDRSLSTAALRELQRSGFVDTGVSLAQARQSLRRIGQHGLPSETMRVLRSAGVDEARIRAYRKAFSKVDPQLVVGVGVFGHVTDRRLVSANDAMVKALRRAARA